MSLVAALVDIIFGNLPEGFVSMAVGIVGVVFLLEQWAILLVLKWK